nr:hypothetical protein [Tanacetum cinerariifolium]
KLEQSSSSDVDPLAYLAKSSTPPQPSPKPTTQAAQTHEEALMATMQQLANLLRGFQKQVKERIRQMGQRSYATTVGEKGEVLDAEAEAFLADVECMAPYEG